MTPSEYAKLVGVTERTIRRRIRQGQIRADLVDGPYGPEYQILEASSDTQSDDPTASRTSDRDPSRTRPPVSPTIPDAAADVVIDLLNRLDRAHRENLELAGRVGWLQAENHRLQEQVKQLSAPAAEPANEPMPADQGDVITLPDHPPAETANHPAGHTNGQHSAAQAPLRPWWRRAIRWLGQPV